MQRDSDLIVQNRSTEQSRLIESQPVHNFKIETLGGDASLLHLASQIDRGIQRKLREKESDSAKKYREWHKMLSPIKYLTIFGYVALTQFERPDWCLDILLLKERGNEQYQDFDEWQCNDAENNYTNMQLPKLPQWITVAIEISCLVILLAFQFVRNQYRDHDDSSRWSWLVLRILSFISIADILICFIFTDESYNYPWLAAMIRPLYLIVSIRLLREYVKRYLQVIQDSLPMVLFTVVYILYFAWMGQRLFSGTLEGVQYFNNFGNSFFNMLVLMTTSNFPDIMLPAYQRNRLACLYFIIYLILGLFLMMNLLLAIFYSNFKFRFEQNIGKAEQIRSQYLYQQFLKCGGKKEYLTQQETYRLFMIIHGLATFSNQDITDEDMEDLTFSMRQKTHEEFSQQRQKQGSITKKRDVSVKQFEYIWMNKVQNNLDEIGKFKFTEMNILLNAYEYWRYENKNKQTFESIDQNETLRQTTMKKLEESNQQQPARKKWAKVMGSPQYELSVNIVGIINILCIVIRQVDITETTNYISRWIYIQMAINALFLIELFSDIIIHGFFKCYETHFRAWPETLCQLMNLIAVVRFILNFKVIQEYNSIVKLFELIIFVRSLKLLTLLYEIKVMRIIIETMRNMMLPLLYLMGVLLVIYYIFAMFGMLFFGGQIKRNLPILLNDQSIPDNYHLDNFNDLLSSFVTLFTLMVVNNWMVQVQFYCEVMNSNYYRFYFGLFYYFSVVIGINIVVAFTIDMYSSVERLDQERTNTLELLREELRENNTIQSPRESGANSRSSKGSNYYPRSPGSNHKGSVKSFQDQKITASRIGGFDLSFK